MMASTPGKGSWLFIVAMCLAYTIVIDHTPLTILTHAKHDDALFMRLGRYLAEGQWLGPFDQYTLMKGPGYPAFLAVANWTGISVSLAHALFHCAAVTFFTLVCGRIMSFAPLWIVLFTLLLWQPIPMTVHLLRVFREEIYYAQLLVVAGLFVATFFIILSPMRRLRDAAILGLFLGWLWLTREEGVTIVLPFAPLLVLAAFRHYKGGRTREFVAILSLTVVIFAVTQIGFSGMNRLMYGKFVGVDYKERNFQRALGAINSVKSEGIHPYISVTAPTRAKMYAASPSFAELAPSFEGASGKMWSRISCDFYPADCQEMAAGFFAWALRDAAAEAGHYRTPRDASVFFSNVADEISSACGRRALDCSPQFIAEMPQVTVRGIVERVGPQVMIGLGMLTDHDWPTQFNQSSGTPEAIAWALRFLNYPAYTPPTGENAISLSPLESICNIIREAVLTAYPAPFLFVAIVGGAAFMVAFFMHLRDAMKNLCWVFAAACWLLVFLRVGLLALITAAAFPAMSGSYLTPAYFMMAAGAVLSCAAWLQLSGRIADPLGDIEPQKES